MRWSSLRSSWAAPGDAAGASPRTSIVSPASVWTGSTATSDGAGGSGDAGDGSGCAAAVARSTSQVTAAQEQVRSCMGILHTRDPGSVHGGVPATSPAVHSKRPKGVLTGADAPCHRSCRGGDRGACTARYQPHAVARHGQLSTMIAIQEAVISSELTPEIAAEVRCFQSPVNANALIPNARSPYGMGFSQPPAISAPAIHWSCASERPAMEYDAPNCMNASIIQSRW